MLPLPEALCGQLRYVSKVCVDGGEYIQHSNTAHSNTLAGQLASHQSRIHTPPLEKIGVRWPVV